MASTAYFPLMGDFSLMGSKALIFPQCQHNMGSKALIFPQCQHNMGSKAWIFPQGQHTMGSKALIFPQGQHNMGNKALIFPQGQHNICVFLWAVQHYFFCHGQYYKLTLLSWAVQQFS